MSDRPDEEVTGIARPATHGLYWMNPELHCMQNWCQYKLCLSGLTDAVDPKN